MVTKIVKSGRNFLKNVKELGRMTNEIRSGFANHSEKMNQLMRVVRYSAHNNEGETTLENPFDPNAAAAQFDRVINTHVAPFHHTLFWGDRLLTIDKSAGFMQEEQFAKAYRSVRGSHQYDQYTSPQTIAWRLHTLVWAAQNGLNVEGDFVECGVFKADFAWVISQVVDFKSKNKQFYLYDTFNGFSDKYSSAEDLSR